MWSYSCRSIRSPRSKDFRLRKYPTLSETSPTRLELFYAANLLSPTVPVTEKSKKLRTTTFPPSSPTCHRILDLPGLPDDFYITPLDCWGDLVAIGLKDTMYLYSSTSNSIVHTIPVAPCVGVGHDVGDGAGDSPYVSSVKFIDDGTRVIAGTSSGHMCMYDVSTGLACSSPCLCADDLRINIMAWNANYGMLSVGGTNGGLFTSCDVHRSPLWTWVKTPTSTAHGASSVCGVRWNMDGTLLATSGDDDRVIVFDFRRLDQPRFVLAGDCDNAGAGTKALSWSPTKKYVLAAGSGVRHGCVRLFDVLKTTTERAHHFTGAQIAGLEFVDPTTIFCAYGYPTGAVATLKWSPDVGGLTSSELQMGHATRAIAAAKGSNGSAVTVGIESGAEETLRLWNVPISRRRREQGKCAGVGDWGNHTIR